MTIAPGADSPKKLSKGAKKASGRDKQIEDLQRQIKACRKEMMNQFRLIDEAIYGKPATIDATTMHSVGADFEVGIRSNSILARLDVIEAWMRTHDQPELYVAISSLKRSPPSLWQRFKIWWGR